MSPLFFDNVLSNNCGYQKLLHGSKKILDKWSLTELNFVNFIIKQI